MSLLGFGAIGRSALGQIKIGASFILAASAVSYAITGNSATFRLSELTSTGAFVVSGASATFTTAFSVSGTSYAWTGFNANEIVMEAGAAGTYIVTGNAAHLTRDFINWLPGGKPSSNWGASGLPSSAWTPASTPSTAWTADPAQAIPATVTS